MENEIFQEKFFRMFSGEQIQPYPWRAFWGCLIIGGGCWGLLPGEATDDTMMTIAVAEGILDNPENPVEGIGKHFIKWYDSKPKDIGNIIRLSIGEYKRSKDWAKAAYYAHKV